MVDDSSVWLLYLVVMGIAYRIMKLDQQIRRMDKRNPPPPDED